MAKYIMSNKEYLVQIEKIASDFETRRRNRRKRFILFTIISVVMCASMIAVALLESKATIEREYLKYVSDTALPLTLELLQYKDTYEVYEARSMGNSNNTLIAGGYFATRNNYVLYPNEDLSDTLIFSGDKQGSFCGELCTYINVFDDNIYFRKDSDRRIYRKSFFGEDMDIIVDKNVGQFLVADGLAYYIDFSDRSSLCVRNLYTMDAQTTLYANVVSFAVFQSHIIVLTTTNELRLLDTSTGSNKLLQENIEKFYFNGGIIVQNNQMILLLDLSGAVISQISIPGVPDLSLVNVQDNIIFFSSNGVLYSFDLATKLSQEHVRNYDLYTSVFRNIDGIWVIAAKIDKENGGFIERIFIGAIN